MSPKVYSFHFFKCYLLLVCSSAFSQTEVYKSEFTTPESKRLSGAITTSAKSILFHVPDHKIYAIDKKEGFLNWEINVPPGKVPFLYKNTFFYSSKGVQRTTQYNLDTGEKIKELSLEYINTNPFFINDIMYCTATVDGGKLIAYSLTENKVLWQENIGFGAEVSPVYLKDKIVANAEDDNWFEIDYSGKLLESKGYANFYLDSKPFFIRKYKFLTHDNKEITEHYLKKHNLSNSNYQIKTNSDNTFILTDKYFLILGNNKKKRVQLNLEKEFPVENFDPDSPIIIFDANQQNVWFSFQNQLLNYDFKSKRLLRKVNLTKWNPYQIILDDRTIWLLSENDEKLYGLDFEPDQKTADIIEAKANYYKCREPDPRKIEAAKAIQEKSRQ